ncbi:peptidase M24 [Spirochaetia bacterium]|nr:peptidase M24 [Spirochaetia bacterium]
MFVLDPGKIQNAIREEGLDGWLFCNFHHRDSLSDVILGRSPRLTNSRLWVYGIPREGEPLGIVHAIEEDHLGGLPGKRVSYATRDELLEALQALAHKRWAVHVSPFISAISYLDAGTAAIFETAGLTLVSAATLIQRFRGLLDAGGIASHERAAAALYEIVETVWDRVSRAYAAGKPLYEGDLRQTMEDEFERRLLITDHPPLAAAGLHSANPHYDFSGSGSPIAEGDIIQLDLWAKEKTPGAMYADISWVGVYGKHSSPEAEKAFADLVLVRDGIHGFIEGELERRGKQGRELSGAEADLAAREMLKEKGYGGAIKHRTGHGIDTECHGSGVNIDGVEFPDPRPILEGSCFSLEPGIYFTGFGLRTEINVYIQNRKPVISGKEPQYSLLHC